MQPPPEVLEESTAIADDIRAGIASCPEVIDPIERLDCVVDAVARRAFARPRPLRFQDAAILVALYKDDTGFHFAPVIAPSTEIHAAMSAVQQLGQARQSLLLGVAMIGALITAGKFQASTRVVRIQRTSSAGNRTWTLRGPIGSDGTTCLNADPLEPPVPPATETLN